MRPLRVAVALLPILLIAGAAPAFSSTTAPLRNPDRGAISALVAHPNAYAHAKARADRRYQRWQTRHGLASTTFAPIHYTAVSGSLNQPGITDASTTGTPSDSTGAIGPSNYVEFINSEIAVYSNTNLTSPTDTLDESTFVHTTDFTCDPQIQWDPEAQRWLYAAIDCAAALGDEQLYFGWSKTASPSSLSSNWCSYTLNTGSNLEDYPKLGHDDSQIIIGTNEFDDSSLGYIQSNIFVFDKPANGVTTCANNSTETATEFESAISGNDFTPVPANIADSSATGYVVAANYSDMSHIDVYSVGRSGGNDTVSAPSGVTVPQFGLPAYVPQPGTSEVLDSLDARLTQAVAVTDPNTTQEGIWTQHTVAGTNGGPSVVRWYELTPGDSTPTQVGTVQGPGSTFAFDAAISPSSDGNNAAIFYNSGSGSQLADWRVQDRHSLTSSGTTAEDLQLATSSFLDADESCSIASGFPCRWGDYAAASPDPSNSALVWGTGMLTTTAPDGFGTPQWGTQNAAIDVTPAANYTLNVSTAGAGAGSVTSGDAQIDCPGTCSHPYAYGSPVTLTETPGANSVFTGWSGDPDCSTAPTCELTMGGPENITATFTLLPEALSLTKTGAGSGTVTSNPAGIRCTSSCSRDFDYGTAVELTATPAAGSIFEGWSGACSGTGHCDVTMNQAVFVTAAFVPERPDLNVEGLGGPGTITSSPAGIDCLPYNNCDVSFTYGTRVTLTATPGSGYQFAGWSGDCTGTGTCTLTMTAARSVSANFAPPTARLTVKRIGTGSGTVTATNFSGIDCGTTCFLDVPIGSEVVLSAAPASGSVFTTWSGNCIGAEDGTCYATVNAAMLVTVTFTKIACIVPYVKHVSLAVARGAIRDGNCSVGTIKRKTSKLKKGKVISQSPGGGEHLARGASVNLVVSKGKPKK